MPPLLGMATYLSIARIILSPVSVCLYRGTLPVAYSCGVSAPNTICKIPFRTKAQIELFRERFNGAFSTVEFTRRRMRNHRTIRGKIG